MPANGSRLAVLMGDIVMSRSAQSTEALHQAFNEVVEQSNRSWRADIVSPLTITLGDEFQGLLSTLGRGFALMRAMRLDLLERGVDCRFALGAATIETPVNPDRAWNMMGPGLSETRALLNDKSDPSAYRFSLPDALLLQAALNTQGYTMTYVEGLWTETQRRYFTRMLSRGDTTNAQVAESLDVSARNLYNVLRAGHRDLYERQIEAIRRTLEALDKASDADPDRRADVVA